MSQQFITGMPVYSATGKKVGTVSERGVQGGYLVVQKGGIFHQTLYVPLNAIRRGDEQGVYLRLYTPYVKQPDEKALSETLPAASSGDAHTLAKSGDTMDWIPIAPGAEEHDDLRVPLREEELVVEKKRREMGRIRVHKYVVEEPQSITLPITHEECRVERVPVKGRVDPGPNVFTETHIEMPLMGEDVVVDKRAQVVEEIHLYKSLITEERAINDVVRKERLHIDDVDDVQDVPTQQMEQPEHPS